MSRIGKQKIELPAGVTVEVKENNTILVKGPKGQNERVFDSRVILIKEDNVVGVDIKNKEKKDEVSLWGTYSSHLKNMILGVSQGFKKQLEINGVGYKVAMQGKDLKLEVGFSHPVIFNIPEGVQASVEKNVITLEGVNKELVGQTASELRAVRKPEPYKGKGIKYVEEVIRRKAGKTAGKGE
ncbi:MAG TPA: 50S ribosomal protein L6 [Candidatus Magasanikbacteria bacterium]|jgi:large subunit ribosomal protein L6|nr:50S ribosomal protein L6 [Candidatus Magasanikbacteria bacterium]HQF57098.1 50S ribosomal protein L6 [Candidatus Magasanikbacteria bacterium]HQL52876.1 50S ribosomal protein L6 [Candidatus Magasanikbacteria bacterium]